MKGKGEKNCFKCTVDLSTAEYPSYGVVKTPEEPSWLGGLSSVTVPELWVPPVTEFDVGVPSPSSLQLLNCGYLVVVDDSGAS